MRIRKRTLRTAPWLLGCEWCNLRWSRAGVEECGAGGRYWDNEDSRAVYLQLFWMVCRTEQQVSGLSAVVLFACDWFTTNITPDAWTTSVETFHAHLGPATRRLYFSLFPGPVRIYSRQPPSTASSMIEEPAVAEKDERGYNGWTPRIGSLKTRLIRNVSARIWKTYYGALNTKYNILEEQFRCPRAKLRPEFR